MDINLTGALNGVIDDMLEGSVAGNISLIGRGASVIEDINITENGTYTAPEGVDGYSPIVVNVPALTPVINSLVITENGTYTAPVGVDGYSPISVSVAEQFTRNVTPLSQSEYNLLTNEQKNNGNIYLVSDTTEHTVRGSFVSGAYSQSRVYVDCGFTPTSINIILPFSNGNTYASYNSQESTTTSSWYIPMESRTYTITLGTGTGETGIALINDKGFTFRVNGRNTLNVNCTFEATGNMEYYKLYYMDSVIYNSLAL